MNHVRMSDNQVRMGVDTMAKNVTLATTGASGAMYAREMLRLLAADERVQRINFVASESSLRVMAEELELSGRTGLVEKLLDTPSDKVRSWSNDDISAGIASGSYPSDGMIVLPCSMGTLGGIANGFAQKLIERAADVCLKERRPLILCVRETPFNLIHIRNMQHAAEAGATIFPAIPTLYNKPLTIEEMVHQFCSRVLQHIGLPQPDAYRWRADI